jgi:predicted GTPase
MQRRGCDPVRKRVVIMGAGGRDFHNFNMVYRDDPTCEVVAFTASQIPNIAGRTYPPELAGPLYPGGIPIVPEEMIDQIMADRSVGEVNFAYSDVTHEYVMHQASRCLAHGAGFVLHGPDRTMLKSRVPVISVCAVRTGCGKSIITLKLALLFREKGIAVSVIRHPMAYCDFVPGRRFGSFDDIDRGGCTIEEREEFEPLIGRGITVFAGIDYRRVLDRAEQESSVIIWDGGNNDFPFILPDLELVLLDALRPGQETRYFPGEVNLRRAHVLILAKVNEAPRETVTAMKSAASIVNPRAAVIQAPTSLTLSDEAMVRGKRALIIEDGPTMTHGGMPFGAGYAAARSLAAEVVDPRGYVVGSLKQVYRDYPHIGPVLPAMGYSREQIGELEETIRNSPADVVVVATPVDLRRLVKIDKPVVRVSYDFDIDMTGLIDAFLARHAV